MDGRMCSQPIRTLIQAPPFYTDLQVNELSAVCSMLTSKSSSGVDFSI